ncbi:tRNA (adenosine(37)-N6)-threonylcarbamoyltransferase complex dimerization subunit type 1 TsaB [uncultured Secundilactobacillus sp.]|uniref:tRNA (adenosine(37)-N6)-threonylcarbamoyltransferase complex dimerization subunit type 1 TsaB n=1 Tax=uncultured Secundilactobacillus sp. TaxID=2813935 RepID=UPI002589DB07|nr:tRNA (adenosine(37)-N6)-threonylcarbamoyltransferase complex dimerization subunit type 1 TsaB [uncultured Secundilactobacillus sp.]
MKILAMDTSNQPLSVAVLEDSRVLATETVTVEQKHAAYLAPIIERLMATSGVKPADLDRVVVADGPGSYTGLRIGVTTAKTLAATLNIELVGVSSLQTIAANISHENQLVAALFDGRNDNVFAGVYRICQGVPTEVTADAHQPFDQFLETLDKAHESLIVLGDTAHFEDRLVAQLGDRLTVLNPVFSLPQATQVARIAQQLPAIKDVDCFVPRYLRLTKAEADWQAQHPKEDGHSYVEKI